MKEIDFNLFKFERQKKDFSVTIIDSPVIEHKYLKSYAFIMDLKWIKTQKWFEVKYSTPRIKFKEDCILSDSNKFFKNFNTKVNNLKDSFFAYVKNKNRIKKMILDKFITEDDYDLIKCMKAIFESSVRGLLFNEILNILVNNPTDSFFAYAEKENQVVETKNVVFNLKKNDSFSNAKKCNLFCKKNIFKNGSTIKRVGPFFDYVKRYIITIKSYFDYFIERKYECRIFAA